jgi:hypothetical protein
MLPNSRPEPARSNAQRIGTLGAAIWARGEDFPVSEEAVINLLAALRHFCIARHINFTACNGVAEGRFNAEVDGDAPGPYRTP